MEERRKINLLRFFALIIALLGAMIAFWAFFIATTLLQMGISILAWVLYWSLIGFLVNKKKWSDDDGQEETKNN